MTPYLSREKTGKWEGAVLRMWRKLNQIFHFPGKCFAPGLQNNMATASPSSLADLRVLKPLLANQALTDKSSELIYLTTN